MPAAKKHPSTRARRNKASTAATLEAVETVDYSTWSLADLRAEIDRRNEDCVDADKLPRTGGKPALAKVLADDDNYVPDLPDRPAGWHKLTVAWWRDVWTSPMSDEWHEATDLHNVIAAAMHYDDMWNAETAAERQKADAAFQKREAALGLTPYDRRRLEWTIETAEDAKDRGRRRRSERPNGSPKPAAGRPDPRGQLHAVK